MAQLSNLDPLLKEVDVPFKSKAQARYMHSQMPEIAKRWMEHTASVRTLPEKKIQKAAKRRVKKSGR